MYSVEGSCFGAGTRLLSARRLSQQHGRQPCPWGSPHPGHLVGKVTLGVLWKFGLAGKEQRGSSDFVRAIVDLVTPRCILTSACEALLAAKQGHCPRSAYFHGKGKAVVAFQRKPEKRARRGTGASPSLHFVCGSST